MRAGESVPNQNEDGSREWALAAAYVENLHRIPPLFTAPIRALMLDENAGRRVANPASEFLVMRLLRSPTFKSIFYFAANTFKADEISNLAYLSSYDLIRLYPPADLAGLIGMIFSYRKIKSELEELAEEDRSLIMANFNIRLELACHLGLAVPKLGILRSIVCSGLPILAHAIMAKEDPMRMLAYKQYLKEEKIIFDLKYELDCWQTTCLHIGARLLQRLGFGPAFATGFIQGLQDRPKSFRDGKVNDLVYPAINLWMEALLETSAAPTVPILGQFYPLQRDLYKLLYEVNGLREKGSKFAWLDKTKSEISPQATPQLYQEVLAELVRSEDVRKFMSENLPGSLVDSLSNEELAEITTGLAEDEF